MTIQDRLKITFVFVALNSFYDLTPFEDEHRWNRRDSVLNGQFHMVAHVYFADAGFSFVVERKFINDWTQSFARWSALRPKINEHWFFSTQHLGFECLFCKFCRHDLSQI